MSNREDKYEDDYGSVGDAREECSSGRSKGTPATRPTGIYKESLRFRRPMLLGTANKDGRPKDRKPYKSHWRLRKDARRKNKKDFYAFFNEHDRRRTTRFLNTFPEMEEFWLECKNS